MFTVNSTIAQPGRAVFADTTRFTQLPAVADNLMAFSGGTPTTLSKPELAELNTLLNKAAAAYNNDTKSEAFNIKELSGYIFQLATVINKYGEKEVWINALCNVSGTDWRNKMQLVMDGGNCYFNIRINLTKKSAGQLYVNGYA